MMNTASSQANEYRRQEEATPAPSLRLDAKSLSQEAYDHIKRMILSGVLKEGEKIPEEKIASILDVSRTPIREALRQLEQYGLVEIKPRSYAKVASITSEEIDNIFLVRQQLERLCLNLLIAEPQRLDPDALNVLATRALGKAGSGNMAEAYVCDSDFHLELVRQSGNFVLFEVLERLDAKCQLIRVRNALSVERYMSNLYEHHEIVRLLLEGDEEKLLDLLDRHICFA